MRTIELGRVSEETLGNHYTAFQIDSNKLTDIAVHPTKIYNRGPTSEPVNKTENPN